ncbi:M56 family metallopeptidase [Flavobacterium enshiense]|uniref:M56 family metallopeptidase n=1 Tax=Flavobacterium enshiense TaxID=1341165 RepID=UPI00345DE60D
MEAFGIYLLKVSALMGVFYVAYLLFLRKETFFNSNRWFLLAGLVTSMVLPFVTYTKVILVDPAPVYEYSDLPLTYAPAEESGFEINWFMVLGIVYGIGIAVFLIKFIIDCFAIKQLIEKPKAIKRSNFYLIDTDKVQSPFSFFNYIVYNSNSFREDELENILQHEQVHSAQKHSLDMMIAQIFCITFWFNPIVWLYKKAIAQNLEFIADAEATKNIIDIKSYQKTLLKVTMQSQCIAITNPFYQSLIKKRIVMLNTNQSSKKNAWKYFVVLPLLAFFMFQFQMKVLAQEKVLPKVENREANQKMVSVVIDKNSSDAEIKKDAEMLKSEFGVTLKVSKVKRNSKGEITAIKVEYKDKDGKKGTTQVTSDEPIQPIQFFKEIDENGKTAIGFGTPRGKGPREGLAKIHKIQRLNDEGEDVEVIIEGDEGDFDWADVLGIDPPLPPDAPGTPDAPGAPDTPKAPDAPKMMKKSVVVKQNGNKKEVWVNGEKVSEDILGDMDFKDMEKAFTFSFDTKGPKGEKGPKDFIFKNEDGDIVITSKEIHKIQKEAMEGAKIQMEEARKRMKDMRPEMEKAKIRMREAQPEMKKMHEEMREEMQKMKQEMQKAKEEMQKAKLELEKVKSSLKDKKA